MNSLQTVLDYLWDDEQRSWEESAGIDFDLQTFDADLVPNHVFNSLVKLKRSKLSDTGYFIHNDALDFNSVVGYGDTALESASHIKDELKLDCPDDYDLDAETLQEWLGL